MHTLKSQHTSIFRSDKYRCTFYRVTKHGSFIV